MNLNIVATGRGARIAAIAAMAGAMLIACILGVATAIRFANLRDETTSRAHLTAVVAEEARNVDLAARAALQTLVKTDLFDQAMNILAQAATAKGEPQENRPRFALLGAAEYQLENGQAILRRSGIQAYAPRDRRASSEAASADRLKSAADALADGLANLLELVPATLSPSPETLRINLDANIKPFWAIWRSEDGKRAFAGLFVVEGQGLSADIALSSVSAPYRAPLAGSYLTLTEYDKPSLASGLRFAALAPMIMIAAMFGIALYIYNLSNQLRSKQLAARHRDILQNIANKQRELDDSEERFRHLAESTNVIPWTADLDLQRFTYVGPQIETLTGYPPNAWLAHGFWAQHIHPSDRNRVITNSVDHTRGGKYATLDYRIRADNGKILHIRNMLTVEEAPGERGKVKKIARGFMLDVTELRKAAAALEVARRKAEEANRVKSEFLANMSHELRTPLNAVIGFSEIMKEEIFGPLDERYREYAESVHASGKHLLALINDVLDLSKIEAGRIELVEEECDIGGLLKECRTLLLERINSAGLHEKIVLDPRLPRVLMDERRIKQVILNLMSNAIKFTPPGGTITLSAQFVGGRGVRVAVRDTGIGMDAQEIPRALAKFGQIDGELARKHDGTGLGLPIAKSLVEMHGGEFEIWSEKGKGTEMRIWLPEKRVVGLSAAS